MKNRKSIFVIAIVTMVMTGCSKNSEKDVQAIDNLRLAYNAAFTSENLQAIDSIIDKDVIWLVPGIPAAVGKDSVLAACTSSFASSNSSLEIKKGDIQVSGDLAILTADYDRTDTIIMDTTSIVKKTSGHNILAFKKQTDGSWKISRDIWNEPALKPCCMNGEKTVCCKMGEKPVICKEGEKPVCSKKVEKPNDKK